MVIFVNYKDNYDTTTTTTANKVMGFDLSAIQSCLSLFVRKHMWLMWTGLGVTLLVIFPMMCIKIRTLRAGFPYNFILLGIFTIAESITLGMVSLLYETEAVLIAAGITTVIVYVLTIFTFQTRIPRSMVKSHL